MKCEGKPPRLVEWVGGFTIHYSTGDTVVVDVKGRPTADAKIKKKMMHYVYPDLKFIWVSYTKRTGWIEYDALQELRRKEKKDGKN